MLTKIKTGFTEFKYGMRRILSGGISVCKLIAIGKTIRFLLSHIRFIRIMRRSELFPVSLDISKLVNNGMLLEFGVASGESTRQIADNIPNKTLYAFDSFKGLPEAFFDAPKGKFKRDKPPIVPDNVVFVIGLFQETLEDFLIEHKENAGFVHLDTDLYSSTKYVLFTLGRHNRIVSGTVIQLDEYYSVSYSKAWTEGVYAAFQEYVETFNIKYEFIAIIRGVVSIKVLSVGEVK